MQLKTEGNGALGGFFNSAQPSNSLFTMHEKEISSYLINKSTYTNLESLSLC